MNRYRGSVYRSLIDFWIDRVWLDWIAPVGAAICFLRWGPFDVAKLVAEKGSFFQTLAGISLGLIGVGTVTVTILVTTTPTGRLKATLQEAGRDLVDLTFACIAGLVLSTFAFTALFAVAVERAILWDVLFVSAVSLTLLRGVRLLWVLRQILRLLI